MLFNSVASVILLIDLKCEKKKIRYTVNIIVSLTIVYFWWITNSLILMNIICFCLLFVLVRTIWVFSLRWAFAVLVLMILFDWYFKVVSSISIFGPSLFTRMMLSLKYYSIPIGFAVADSKSNVAGTCSVVSLGDIFYPCLFLAYLKRWDPSNPYYFRLTFWSYGFSQVTLMIIVWIFQAEPYYVICY